MGSFAVEDMTIKSHYGRGLWGDIKDASVAEKHLEAAKISEPFE